MSQPPVPPSYGSPEQPSQYAAPGYPAPGAAPAGFPAPAPKKKSSVGKIILIVLGVVGLLCVGGIAISAFALKDTAKEVKSALDTRVVAPETLNGRPKITAPEQQSASDAMVSGLKAEVPNATSTIGAFYGDPAKQDMIMLIGVSAPIVAPEKELDDAMKSFGSSGMNLTNVTKVDAGPLGGSAKCGDAETSGIKMGVCGWADNGSLGMIIVYFKTAAEIKGDFVKMRGEVEKKG